MLHGSTGRIFFHLSLLRRPSLTKVLFCIPGLCMAQLQHLHRITEKLKPTGVLQPSSPTPHSKQDKLEQMLQGLVHSNSEYLQGWRWKSQHFSGLCLCQITHVEKVFPCMKWEFLQFQLKSITSCCCHAQSPALSPQFPHTEELQAKVGSLLALFLPAFTWWTSPVFRAAPWAHSNPTNSLVAVPEQPHCSCTFPGQVAWNGALCSSCSPKATKHKTVRHFTAFFRKRMQKLNFLLSVYCIFMHSTLDKPCSLQFTEQHKNIGFAHHLWMFAVPGVSVSFLSGSQRNHCSHKGPCKGTSHKSFSVAGKKDSQVSLSDVKCSKYISDSSITQDTMLLDTCTSADTFRNFSPKTCHSFLLTVKNI